MLIRLHKALQLACLGSIAWVLLSPFSTQVLGMSQDKPTPTELEGTWDAEQQTRDGVTLPYKPGELWAKFVGNRMTSLGIINLLFSTEVDVLIDSTARPKHLDFQMRAIPKKCIYELKGDVLLLAIPVGTAPRPTAFESENTTIIKLKRRKATPLSGKNQNPVLHFLSSSS
jgi:uncharacterized protein (TIGR03067 family)